MYEFIIGLAKSLCGLKPVGRIEMNDKVSENMYSADAKRHHEMMLEAESIKLQEIRSQKARNDVLATAWMFVSVLMALAFMAIILMTVYWVYRKLNP